MKKFFISKLLFFCTVFFLVLTFFPNVIFASSSPRLINDEVRDFVLGSICENQGIAADIDFSNDEILETLLGGSKALNRFGTEQTFHIEGRSVIGIEVRPDEIVEEQAIKNFLSNAVFSITTPSGEKYSITAKNLLVFELSESGEYKVELVKDDEALYYLDIYRLRSPFYGDVSFLGANIDFDEYKGEFENYIDDGGNVVVYQNEQTKEYLGIETSFGKIKENVENENEKIEMIFDNYYEAGDEISTISSSLANRSLIKYRGVDLALSFEGQGDDGNVVVLNPAVFTLEEFEIEDVLNELPSDTFVFRSKVESEGFNIEKLIFYASAAILLFLAYLIFGNFFKNLFTKEDFFRKFLSSLENQKKKVESSVLFLNSLFLIFTIFIIGAAFYIQTNYQRGTLAVELSHIIYQFEKFLSNYGVGGFEVFLLLIFSVLLLADLSIVCWLRWDQVQKLKSSFLKSIWGTKLTQRKKIVLKFGVILLLTLLAVFLYMLAFGLYRECHLILTIILSILTVFIIPGVYHLKIKFGIFEKKVLNVFKIIIILAPLSFVLYLLYSYTTPFGLDRKYILDEAVLNGEKEHPNFMTSFDDGILDVTFLPEFEKKDVETTITQKLRSENPVYLQVASEDSVVADYLFFDEGLVGFDQKTKTDELYLYSKSKGIRDLGHLPEGSLVGLDRTSFSMERFSDDPALFKPQEYYKDMKYTKGELDLDLGIGGSIVFYTVLGDSLDLNITYVDKNENLGRDDFVVKLIDRDDKVVKYKYIKDDGKSLYGGDSNNTVELGVLGIEEGVYKVIISSPSLIDIMSISPDLTILNLTINSPKLVFSYIDGGDIVFKNPTDLYFFPLEMSTEIASYLIPNGFSENKCDILGLTADIFNDISLSYEEIVYDFDVDISELKHLKLKCENRSFKNKYNLFSFTKQSYFYPFQFYFTEINQKDDIVISKSNFDVNETGDDWYNTKITYFDDYKFYVPVRYYFVSVADKRSKFQNYCVGELKFIYYKNLN